MSLDPKTVQALSDAVREVESCSCAELVLEVRARSGSYAHADARLASLLAFIALLLLLFSPWHFSAMWVAIDVLAVWFIGLMVARRSDRLRRVMTTRREREVATHTSAQSCFHDRGIANTSGETGVLVYLSLLERRLELLADRGVLEAVPSLDWNRIVEEARAHAATPESLVHVVRSLAPLLSKHLPSREGDVDELSNMPRFVSE